MSPAARQPRRVRQGDGADGRSADELRQLRATVVALRDELDRSRIAEEARMQAALNAAHDEVRALRETIQVLRDELDATVSRAREARDRQEAEWRTQLVEARSTIEALRTQLERRSEAPPR